MLIAALQVVGLRSFAFHPMLDQLAFIQIYNRVSTEGKYMSVKRPLEEIVGYCAF